MDFVLCLIYVLCNKRLYHNYLIIIISIGNSMISSDIWYKYDE